MGSSGHGQPPGPSGPFPNSRRKGIPALPPHRCWPTCPISAFPHWLQGDRHLLVTVSPLRRRVCDAWKMLRKCIHMNRANEQTKLAMNTCTLKPVMKTTAEPWSLTKQITKGIIKWLLFRGYMCYVLDMVKVLLSSPVQLGPLRIARMYWNPPRPPHPGCLAPRPEASKVVSPLAQGKQELARAEDR